HSFLAGPYKIASSELISYKNSLKNKQFKVLYPKFCTPQEVGIGHINFINLNEKFPIMSQIRHVC
ncbi:hypothetical protein DIZ73_20140, partial [Legionella pneumophila]